MIFYIIYFNLSRIYKAVSSQSITYYFPTTYRILRQKIWWEKVFLQPWIWKDPDPDFKNHWYTCSQHHIVLLLTPVLTPHHSTQLQFSYRLVQLPCSATLQDRTHNFCLTVHLLDSSEPADYSWDPWIKHNNKMTFPHPVWMSWRLIPSKAASPYDIESAIPPNHLCP